MSIRSYLLGFVSSILLCLLTAALLSSLKDATDIRIRVPAPSAAVYDARLHSRRPLRQRYPGKRLAGARFVTLSSDSVLVVEDGDNYGESEIFLWRP